MPEPPPSDSTAFPRPHPPAVSEARACELAMLEATLPPLPPPAAELPPRAPPEQCGSLGRR
ncbi:MAG: hypothetical protein ACR2H9_07865 [Longimicrobiaceae bacterium]